MAARPQPVVVADLESSLQACVSTGQPGLHTGPLGTPSPTSSFVGWSFMCDYGATWVTHELGAGQQGSSYGYYVECFTLHGYL